MFFNLWKPVLYGTSNINLCRSDSEKKKAFSLNIIICDKSLPCIRLWRHQLTGTGRPWWPRHFTTYSLQVSVGAPRIILVVFTRERAPFIWKPLRYLSRIEIRQFLLSLSRSWPLKRQPNEIFRERFAIASQVEARVRTTDGFQIFWLLSEFFFFFFFSYSRLKLSDRPLHNQSDHC
jgi:hypothetical protein